LLAGRKLQSANSAGATSITIDLELWVALTGENSDLLKPKAPSLCGIGLIGVDVSPMARDFGEEVICTVDSCRLAGGSE